MTAAALTALLPIIAAAAIPVALILAIGVRRSERWALTITLIGFGLVIAMSAPAARLVPIQVTDLLEIDGLALFFGVLAALAGAATALFARNDPGRGDEEREELYVLLALAVLGAIVLASSRHLAALFLGLELMSVSLFPLLAYGRRRPEALEAAVKYLVISGVGTGLLLFGMALLYAGLGSLELAAIGEALAMPGSSSDAEIRTWVMGGLLLAMAGLGVKLSLFPLHWWTPDVYQGAPSAVAGFLASVAKGAVVVVLLRLIVASGAHAQPTVVASLEILAILSMLGGNLLALLQKDVRRILAYSSIAHMGYLLVALVAAGDLALEAMSLYLVAYFISTLGAFGVLTLLGDGERRVADMRGLFRRRPWLAVIFTLMLLSLAGIPLTAGFIGKFYLFAAGVDGALWAPVAVLAAGSVIGLFYYLRIILALYTPSAAQAPARVEAGLAGASALVGLTLILIWLGTWPEPIIGLIRWAVLD
jgi:NADH-quinone oxidoreductase subunit N